MTWTSLRRVIGAAAVLVICATFALAGQQGEHLETFDEAWRIIAETHWDPEFNGVDWEAVRDELRPRAAAAESVGELRAIIRDMLGRLGQSHFALWPGDALENLRAETAGEVGGGGERRGGGGDPGFEVMLVEDQFVVSAVDPDGSAAVAGVAMGWIIRRVGRYEIGDSAVPEVEDVDEHTVRAEAQRAMEIRLARLPFTMMEVDFLDENDELRTVQIEIDAPAGRLSRFGNLPPIYATLESEVMQPDTDLDVGIIAFNIWLPAVIRPFDEAIDTMRHADGIILDLRGNPGGLGAMVMGTGGHFVDENISLGTMRSRQNDLDFVTNPRRVDTSGQRVEPYAGPLAILIDNGTASTSEVFAGGLQAVGRARIFGQRSMGAVLPSMMDELPNGDVLQHAFADFLISGTGVRLEGLGVFPDEPIDVTRQALLAGRDLTLEAAVEWIVRQR